MATIAHCLFCFDVLSARLDKRKCLSLNQVQDLWDAYNDQRGLLSIDDDDGDDGDDEFLQTKKKVKIQKEGPESSSLNKEASSSRAGSEEDEEGGKVNEEEPQRVQSPYGSSSPAAVAQKKEKSLLSFPLALPSISRLRDSSRSGSGSGSNSSTPSTLSTASSRSALTESSSSSSSSVNNNNNNNNPSSVSSFSSVSSVSSISSSLSSSASSRRPYLFAYRTEQQDVDKQYPLFVTWNTISSRGTKSLRGCIGTFDPTELSQGLKSYALTAALNDTRFSPITISELPSLSVSVTLLLNFTPASNPFDWTIGTHGVRLSFTHHGRRYQATYLPDVAAEQGWSQEETLVSLMRKAGWTGRSGEWRKVADLKVVRYEGRKASAGFEEWREWREWVDGREGMEAVGV